MNWTDEQLKAIMYREKSAIVSAAAGSGKTAILVERVLRIIADEENKTPADKMVIVTFTTKAAAELKERLKKALAERIEKDGSPYLAEQLVRLEEANISTISSFCLELIRLNVNKLPLTGGFTVIDEAENGILKQRAAEDTLDAFYGSDFSDEERAAMFNTLSGRGDEELITQISSLYEFTRNVPNPEEWIAAREKEYSDPKALCEKLKAVYAEYISGEIDKCLKIAENNVDYAANQYDYMLKAAESDREAVNGWRELADEQPHYQALFETDRIKLLSSISWARLSPKRGEDYDPDVKKTFDDARKKLKTAVGGLVSDLSLLSVGEEDVALCAPAVLILIRLFRIYEQRFSALKLMRNKVDFSDIEQMTLQILRTDGGDKIGLSYDMIIVDEFQDSNDVQYEIFRLLSRNESNLFFVGDIKQSIYRFRGANPLVFRSVSRNENYTLLTLNRNFRSGKEVIEGVNAIFESVMTETVGETAYDNSARLVQGLTENSGGEDAKAALYVLNKDEIKAAGLSDVEAEALLVADKIAEMVESKTEIIDKSGEKRPCSYGDFAILLRALQFSGDVFEKALKSRGIPVAELEKADYLSLEEISLAIDLLTVIDNPYTDSALLNVMMSPLYSATADDMAEIRLSTISGKSDKRFVKPLFSSVVACAKRESDGNAPALCRKLVYDLEGYRKIAANGSVERLIRGIVESADFLAAVSYAGPRGAANLRLLLHYADIFVDGNAAGSLGDFLGFVESVRNGGSFKAAAAAAENSGAVRLMTIHGSKGLEFPICFVSKTNSKFNMQDSYDAVLADINYGIAMSVTDRARSIKYNTFPHRLFEMINESKTLSEEMRMLYVAATRARDRLIFTAAAKDGEAENAADNSYLNWIVKSEAEKKKKLKIIKFGVPEAIDVNAASDERLEIVSSESGRLLAEKMQKSYCFEPMTKIPAKFTATQIGVKADVTSAEAEADEPSVFPRRPSFLKETKLTGKKRGDAYHKAMQLIDFAAGGYEKQLAAMRGRFTEQEYGCIKPEDICGFFETELGKRAAKSEQIEKEYPIFAELKPSMLTEYCGSADEFTDDDLPFVQGIADMFFYENGKIILVDYKTNRNTSAEKLTAEYRGQLEVYRFAIAKLTGKEVAECWLYSFERGAVQVF